MVWKVDFSATAQKVLSKIDRKTQLTILAYLETRVATDEDPRRFGEALRKNLSGLWKYRVGAYRLICDIQDDKLVVLVVRLGHRGEVYSV